MRAQSWVVAVVVALVVGMPIGYAVADTGDKGASEMQASDLPNPDDLVSGEPKFVGQEVEYAIEGGQPENVDGCRADLKYISAADPFMCVMVLGVDSGDLQPGEFSTEQLEAEKRKLVKGGR